MQNLLSIRVNGRNRNHHIFSNNGTLFLHFVCHPTAITKQRYRVSLKTRSWGEARKRRNEVFRQLRRGMSLEQARRVVCEQGVEL